MDFRRMIEEDLEQVANIERSVFSRPWSYDSFKKSLSLENAIYMVCENNGEVLGYCGLYCVINEGNITNVAVKESVRNKGIGYGILVALLDEAKKYGVDMVNLEVRKSNEAAIHLYEQLGFSKEGIRKNFYTFPTEDALIMVKNIL